MKSTNTEISIVLQAIKFRALITLSARYYNKDSRFSLVILDTSRCAFSNRYNKTGNLLPHGSFKYHTPFQPGMSADEIRDGINNISTADITGNRIFREEKRNQGGEHNPRTRQPVCPENSNNPEGKNQANSNNHNNNIST